MAVCGSRAFALSGHNADLPHAEKSLQVRRLDLKGFLFFPGESSKGTQPYFRALLFERSFPCAGHLAIQDNDGGQGVAHGDHFFYFFFAAQIASVSGDRFVR